MRGIALRASLALGFCLLGAPSAGATPPGVHVDPSSPGGKEYAIPLDQARNDATGGGGTQSPGSSTGGGSGTHLFGVGVGHSGGGGSGSSGSGSGSASASHGSKRGGSRHNGSTGAGSRRSAGSARLSALNLAAANPEAGPQTPLLVLGASAGIIFAGVLLGLMLRRRRTPGASA
ncbi:MAG: hypothetical protein QOE38_142 [Thermoleophilaceae bacterium]|nr:hypothetical protein [Thermoleophilaceae bacterium]